jgi:hypothetical protein
VTQVVHAQLWHPYCRTHLFPSGFPIPLRLSGVVRVLFISGFAVYQATPQIALGQADLVSNNTPRQSPFIAKPVHQLEIDLFATVAKWQSRLAIWLSVV